MQVVAPVQRHVSAKRLLCSLDETYYAGAVGCIETQLSPCKAEN